MKTMAVLQTYNILAVAAALLLEFASAVPRHENANAVAAASWKKLAPMPQGPIHEHSTVALGNSLFTIGGVTLSSGVISTVAKYDIPSNKWTTVNPYPTTINHANVAVVDGKIYVLGGMTGASWAGTLQSYVYDPASDKWTAISAGPKDEGRGSAAVGIYNGTVWLAGGKSSGTGGKSVDTVSAFDTISGKWLANIPNAAKKIPEARDHGGGVVIGTKFYQIAGSLQKIENRKDTVFVLDLENPDKGWITAKGRMPTPRRGISVGAIGTKIYTFGGEGNPDIASKGVYDNVEVYDTVADSWEKLAPMEIPRHGTYAAVADGKVYIPGGGTASGTPCTDAFDVYSP